jgi:murein DD-endopeptidase MepM/ murein hydrolase activator NlpD
MIHRIAILYHLLFALFCLSQMTGTALAQKPSANRSASISGQQRQQILNTLPLISTFLSEPSNQFIVDLSNVRRGHPYRGRDAEKPHTGGHLYFNLDKVPDSPNDPATFPAIYAVADGVITRIDYSFRLREMFEPALNQRVANQRYGLGLTFARSGTTAITFHYSIEPFIDPKDPTFYEPFILVKPGQRVKKGEIIARMYIPPMKSIAEKTHIHFNLIREGGGGFISPSIFSKDVVREFHRRWNLFPNDPDSPIPPCMGYKLQAEENPFQRKAVTTL